MNKLDFLDKAKLRNEYSHFSNKIVDKEFLKKQHAIKEFETKNHHCFSNTILAMFDMTKDDNFPAKTIVFDLKNGIYLSDYSTKQLINKYIKKATTDYMIVRTLMQCQKMKRNMPLITGVDTFVPMRGAVHHTTDWISVNWIDKFRQNKKTARFYSTLGFDIELEYRGKDINKLMHDSCVLGKCFEHLVINSCNRFGYEVRTRFERGILDEYDKCECLYHLNMEEVTLFTVRKTILKMILNKIYRLPELCLIEECRDETIKYWMNYIEILNK